MYSVFSKPPVRNPAFEYTIPASVNAILDFVQLVTEGIFNAATCCRGPL